LTKKGDVGGEKMARMKSTCSKCGRTILLFFEDEEFAKDIAPLKKGELLEHKCPACEEWAVFEIDK
jgi:ribosomal protein S27E